jgi:hypothetical protein
MIGIRWRNGAVYDSLVGESQCRECIRVGESTAEICITMVRGIELEGLLVRLFKNSHLCMGEGERRRGS